MGQGLNPFTIFHSIQDSLSTLQPTGPIHPISQNKTRHSSVLSGFKCKNSLMVSSQLFLQLQAGDPNQKDNEISTPLHTMGLQSHTFINRIHTKYHHTMSSLQSTSLDRRPVSDIEVVTPGHQ